MHGCGRGEHVAGVREGREGGHVAGQGGRAEGAALVHQALGEVVHAVLGLFALLGLVGHLAVAGLDSFLLHGQRSVDLGTERTAASGQSEDTRRNGQWRDGAGGGRSLVLLKQAAKKKCFSPFFNSKLTVANVQSEKVKHVCNFLNFVLN